MDEFDRASEFENKERELRIAAARNKPVVTPNLGCMDCSNITHEQAKLCCQDFAACLSDWQKVELIKKIEGNKNA